jgi:TRAP-type mannitol/chloroaromatic compound transport system permease small subunit
VPVLLRLSSAIDWLNSWLGKIANFLVLLACVISAGNAMVRYAFDMSSNGWLEVQWYMFALLVMFGRPTRSSASMCAWTYQRTIRARPALARHSGHCFLPHAISSPWLGCPGRSSGSRIRRRFDNAGGLVRWP